MTETDTVPLDARARDRILSAAYAAPTVPDLFASVSAALAEAVPSAASGWFGVDSATLLPTWPARIENLAPGHCDSYWEREFFQHDTLLFRHLAVSASATGALRDSLDGLMTQSARYREFMEPNGYQDELRSTFSADDSIWGLLVLLRRDDLPSFTAAEVRFVDTLSEPLAVALRAKVHAGPASVGQAGPGILTYDLDGQLLSANDAALYWVDRLPNSEIAEQRPVALSTVVAYARAVEAGRAHGTGHRLLPSRDGTWLRLEASVLRNIHGEPQSLAVTIGPADRSELATILAKVYGLSRRETDVTQRLARGESTAVIATALFLSEHTVRDHVKSVLAKTGVSSRGALVARLFFEHTHANAELNSVHV
jgi:DNA-binding CsgD family transcriptional regulator